jgi:hypothetical protein
MIHLQFEGGSPAGSITLGPAPWFRIAGNFIRQGPDGAIVGTFRRHQWEVESKHFTRFDCKERAAIHFQDAAGGATEDYGPFASLYASDGVMYADGKLFAKFIEESQLWHCYPTENFWPVIVIKAAPASASGPA